MTTPMTSKDRDNLIKLNRSRTRQAHQDAEARGRILLADISAQLTAPSSASGLKRRRVLRAIAANPGLSDRAIGELAGVDHKTVAARRGEMLAIGGEIPTATTEEPS